MSFPGLYNEVTPVSTERTTVPTAAVLTHVLFIIIIIIISMPKNSLIFLDRVVYMDTYNFNPNES